MTTTAGKITVEEIKDLVEITAGLVREGVIFEVCKHGGYWIIEFSGGC